MVILAPAKLNLGLTVFTPEAGQVLHALDTVMAPLELADILTVTPASSLRVTCSPEVSPERENLAYRAAALLGLRLHIHIDKRIPVGRGLGGGSSDAGVLLRTFGGHLPLAELTQLALSLGSDVPFFLHAGVARVQGRGECIAPLSLPASYPRAVLIVIPPFSIATREAYALLDAASVRHAAAPCDELFSSHAAYTVTDASGLSFTNDFEYILFPRYPELAIVKAQLLASGARAASLTGGGSALFGLYDALPAIIPSFPPGFTCISTHLT